MRFVLSILNGSLFNLEIDTDEAEPDDTKPPFGFAGSGSGVTETTEDFDPILDRPSYSIDQK